MKTTFGLGAAAAVLAAVGVAYTQPSPERPSLPPLVLDPGVKLPPVPPPKVALPPLPVVPPAPLPVPQPLVPAAKAEPTKLPAVPPPPPVAQPLPPPAALPKVPPPVAQPLPPPQALAPVAPPSAGSVVVLADGKVIEGHVSRTADKVVVRRAGADQPFPKEQVKYVASSRADAYRLALADTKADDAAARLRLARWCMYNGLREQALTEAKEAVRLEPENRTAGSLVRTLEESLRLYPGDGNTRAAPTPPAPALPSVPPPPLVPAVTVPEPDVAPEAAVAFGPRVQPVLMNQCASCHAKSDHVSAFKLTPVAPNEVSSAAVTRANLAAAAAQVKKSEPAASPLLVKALTAHGGQGLPAFADRDAAAFRVLQAWVHLTQGDLAPPAPVADVRPALPLPPPATVPPIPPAEGSIPPIPPASDNPGFGRTAPPPIPVVPSKDEFDPENFNRPGAGR